MESMEAKALPRQQEREKYENCPDCNKKAIIYLATENKLFFRCKYDCNIKFKLDIGFRITIKDDKKGIERVFIRNVDFNKEILQKKLETALHGSSTRSEKTIQKTKVIEIHN